jgi:four helix bundle protein
MTKTSVNSDVLKKRTMLFALKVIRLVDTFPKSTAGNVVGKQLIRAATSVGANYRAVCRARSRAEFIAKMGIVIEEADEALYWMELSEETGFVKSQSLIALKNESNELVAIFVASSKTAKNYDNV